MRKSCKRMARRATAPTMVALLLNPEVSLQERQCIEALRGGWATTDHFNVLADCRDMLSLAAAEKRDDAVQAVCDVGFVALDNMKARYAKLKRIGASGEELQALMALVDVSEDFWKRQSGGLFVDADKAMCRARDGYREGAR